MKKLLTFHLHGTAGNPADMLPAYYMDRDYEKVAVRIRAMTAPTREAKIDIYDDGVSIFAEQGSQRVDLATGAISTLGAGTSATLAGGETSEDVAEDFTDVDIEEGSWITCRLLDAGGGADFTVQLELRQMSEDDERED